MSPGFRSSCSKVVANRSFLLLISELLSPEPGLASRCVIRAAGHGPFGRAAVALAALVSAALVAGCAGVSTSASTTQARPTQHSTTATATRRHPSSHPTPRLSSSTASSSAHNSP